MKEEVARIMRLVQEGKLSPEDAAELIDAFQASEAQEAVSEPVGPPPPPPPPPHSEGQTVEDPFRRFVDTMENLGKEVSQSINWHEVARQVREGAAKGVEGIKQGVDQIRQGKGPWGWFSTCETREITLPLSKIGDKTLKIENPCGDVKVVGGFETGSVSAQARICGHDSEEARAKADEYTVIIEESDSQVVIRQPDVSGLEVDLVVQLERAASVEVRTNAGDVSVLDTKGGSRVNNHSGDVKLRGLDGPIEVSTHSGDIELEDSNAPTVTLEGKSGDIRLIGVRGIIKARTSSGDVEARNSAGPSLSAESVNGDVDVEIVEPVRGSVTIRTVNGDATVAIPPESNCQVKLSTIRGDVHCSVSLNDEVRLEQRITGTLGDGAGTLDVSGVNGDVSLTALRAETD